jgi:hypothetical protein
MEMEEPHRGSAWANGLFYLFSIRNSWGDVGGCRAIGIGLCLTLSIDSGVIFVPVIGALQLKMDRSLTEKSFLELMRMAIGQLPMIGKLVTRAPDTKMAGGRGRARKVLPSFSRSVIGLSQAAAQVAPGSDFVRSAAL